MKKILILTVSLFLSYNTLLAQQAPLYSTYNLNKMIINPSLTGSDATFSAGLISRFQFAGFEGAPNTNALLLEYAPEEKPYGIGIQAYNDKMGITNNSGAQFNYAYRLKFSDNFKIGFGLGLGLDQWTYNVLGAKVDNPNDPNLFNRNMNVKTFKADFGAHINYKQLLVSVAVPKVYSSDITFTNTGSNNNVSISQLRHIVTYVGYNILTKSEKYTITPSALVRLASNVDPQFDLNLMVNYNKKVYGTLGYRNGYAGSVGAGLFVNNRVRAGYAFDFPLGSIKGYNTSSHEMTLGFRLGKSVDNN